MMRYAGLILALAFTITLAGATLSNAGEIAAGEFEVVKVEIAKFNFTPAEVHIRAGDTIEWVNRDVFIHTATSGQVEKGRRNTAKHPDGEFDSGDIKEGKSFRVTFSEKGAYPYYCDTHPFMEGKVIVD